MVFWIVIAGMVLVSVWAYFVYVAGNGIRAKAAAVRRQANITTDAGNYHKVNIGGGVSVPLTNVPIFGVQTAKA